MVIIERTLKPTHRLQPKKPTKPPAPIKICTQCQGEMAPGVSHECTKTARNSNVVELVKNMSGKSQGQILSKLIRDKCEEENSSTLTLSTYRKPMQITKGQINVEKKKGLH